MKKTIAKVALALVLSVGAVSTTWSYTMIGGTDVAEPGTLALFGLGLLGLAATRKKLSA